MDFDLMSGGKVEGQLKKLKRGQLELLVASYQGFTMHIKKVRACVRACLRVCAAASGTSSAYLCAHQPASLLVFGNYWYSLPSTAATALCTDLCDLLYTISLPLLVLFRWLQLEVVPWDLVIFDEVHHLKNPATASHKAALQLSEDAVVLGLSGTPIQNDPIELWAAYNIIYPGLLEQSQADFKKEYNGPIKAAMKDTAKPDVRAFGRHKSALLQSIIAPHFLAMTKQDVGEGRVPLVLYVNIMHVYHQYFVRDHVLLVSGRLACLPAHCMGLEGCSEKVVFVDLSTLQRELYLAILALPDFKMLAQCRYVNCVYCVYSSLQYSTAHCGAGGASCACEMYSLLWYCYSVLFYVIAMCVVAATRSHQQPAATLLSKRCLSASNSSLGVPVAAAAFAPRLRLRAVQDVPLLCDAASLLAAAEGCQSPGTAAVTELIVTIRQCAALLRGMLTQYDPKWDKEKKQKAIEFFRALPADVRKRLGGKPERSQLREDMAREADSGKIKCLASSIGAGAASSIPYAVFCDCYNPAMPVIVQRCPSRLTMKCLQAADTRLQEAKS
eukprot:16671-Heterococcus_DN1.PRE.2